MFLPRLLGASQAGADAFARTQGGLGAYYRRLSGRAHRIRRDVAPTGYEVYSAANAAEAMTIPRRDVPIDVLFTDVVMPNGMNDIELVREARRLRPQIRVPLCSGYARAGIQTDETTTFLPKPYLMADLARELAALMSHPPHGD
jgi:CheY-like chemotaxis protein